MKITPQLLELIKNPLVQQRRGKQWKDGDLCYNDDYGVGIVVNSMYEGNIHVRFYKFGIVKYFPAYATEYDLYWIPLPFNPINPERSVYKWINGRINLHIYTDGICDCEVYRNLENIQYQSGADEDVVLIVLLKQYLHQSETVRTNHEKSTR